jgi:hypothetical protein
MVCSFAKIFSDLTDKTLGYRTMHFFSYENE